MPLEIRVCGQDELSAAVYDEIRDVCSRAFHLDYHPFLQSFPGRTHVLGVLEGRLVSHALWITRWLQQGDGPLLRTAYVEGVATAEAHRHRGFGSAVMRRLAEEILGFDLAALSTDTFGFYQPLGWERWRGPLYWRKDGTVVPCPDASVMILRLPASPPLDVDGPLSAEWREGEVW